MPTRKGDSQFDQVPPNSFPAKLTRVLFERYKAFNGAADKGLVILSCELIDNNGKELQKCCNNYAKDWNLEPAFIDWMNNCQHLLLHAGGPHRSGPHP